MAQRTESMTAFGQQYMEMLSTANSVRGERHAFGSFRVAWGGYDWVERAAKVEGNPNEATIFNGAILVGAFVLFAEYHGLQTILATPTTAGSRPLPDLPQFRRAPSDVVANSKFAPGVEAWSSLIWTQAHTKVHQPQLTDNGLRILSALADMPEGSRVAAHNGRQLYRQELPFEVRQAASPPVVPAEAPSEPPVWQQPL